MQLSVWKKWTFVNPAGTSFHNKSFTMCRVRVHVKLVVSEWRGMAGRLGALFLDSAPLQCKADRSTGMPRAWESPPPAEWGSVWGSPAAL